MTVLVTGGAGYIGSHTVLALAEAGEDVVVIDDLSTGFAAFVPENVPLFIGDAGDPGLLSHVLTQHPVACILHFAGSAGGADSIGNPLFYYRNNFMTTRNLLSSALDHGVKAFVFSSTAAVYGDPDVIPVAEDAPTRPLSPFGSSKLMTEIMLHDTLTAFGLRHVTLRHFSVAGADPSARLGPAPTGTTNLFRTAVEAASGQRAAIEVFGTDYPTQDGSCIRDFVHVSDVAQAHVAALAHLRQGGESLTLNCGSGRGTSVLEIIDVVGRLCGRRLIQRPDSRRPGDITASVADVGAIRSLLGWKPQYDNIDTIAAHCLTWEKRLLEERHHGKLPQAGVA
ncbi:MAG: UDP-glucose 4-epimerase GalE [Alphaproteobacteria bacterium]|nr:UDP-glucose 4-epimerase GalE [Alphaproteobacteria bacterium]